MKFAHSMFRDWVESPLTAHELGDLLTMAGFELESIEPASDDGNDFVLDVKVMSNRGDGLSMLGLAREVLAKSETAKPTELYRRATERFTDVGETWAAGPLSRVEVQTEDCTRYACATFRQVRQSPTPPWIKDRLEKAGTRSLGLIVDLTNYVMLETGQPLHAFDLAKLRGSRIVVRSARPGEKLTTLNGQDHDLRPDQMMICDAERPVGAAGIMGGLETEVDDATNDILLESAHFTSTSVRRTRKQMGLSTEASYRFERSVDPEGVVAALRRFAELLKSEGGMDPEEFVDVYPHPRPERSIELSVARAVRLLGMPVERESAIACLTKLGFTVSGSGDELIVAVPGWRPDVVREQDLIEEIGRVVGYDRIPEALPVGATTLGGLGPNALRLARVRETLIRLGFSQTVSHSLRDLHPLDAPGKRVGPRNPGSPELASLRNSLLPSLADAARRNGGKDVHLFEIGEVFHPGIARKRSLGLISVGGLNPLARANEWTPEADFYSLKGAIVAAAEEIGVVVEVKPGAGDSRTHPGRSASFVIGSEPIGTIGEIHPEIAAKAGLAEQTVVAEIDVEALLLHSSDRLAVHPISRNPAVRRDVSVLVSKEVPYKELEAAIASAAGEELERQWLFDVYEGAGIPAGSHSVSVALQLRKLGSNFTDEEANQVRAKVVAALESVGATAR